MSEENLKNKPLVEAIFELRWALKDEAAGTKIDPHYRLLVGRLYDKVSSDYSVHEPLSTADFPDAMVPYRVQHRFRSRANGWPLVQIGPGIVALNDTEAYVWADFRARSEKLIAALFAVYPEPEKNLVVTDILLRYIDAIEFDYSKDDIFKFLKDHLKTMICLEPSLFEVTQVQGNSPEFDLRFSFPSTTPPGKLNLRFGRGLKNDRDALFWETQIQTKSASGYRSPADVLQSLDDAHSITHKWFIKAIEGDLRRRFE